jgi:hypothetical protein
MFDGGKLSARDEVAFDLVNGSVICDLSTLSKRLKLLEMKKEET